MNAFAKLNLFLHVEPVRDDGYHPLQSWVAFAGYGDALHIEAGEKIGLAIIGPFAEGLRQDREENIILRAAHALQRWAVGRGYAPMGATITLTKNLPIASGIGGGSADAAATLRALVWHWDLDIEESILMQIGLGLGADVPVCLYGATAWMEGVGEQISPGPSVLPLPLVLVNPGRAVSTAQVFKAFDGRGVSTPPVTPDQRPTDFSDTAALIRFLGATRNDLEEVAAGLVPEIAMVLAALKSSGATFVRMSGSGATCFGLYDEAAQAEMAVNHIRATHEDWWVQQTTLTS